VRRSLFRNRNLEVNTRRELAREITRQDLQELVQIHHRDHTLIRIVTIEFERRGYPEIRLRNLRRPKAHDEASGPPPASGPRGLSFDDLRAMLEADLRAAEEASRENSGDASETEAPPSSPEDPEE
jgi:hypothetical protein